MTISESYRDYQNGKINKAQFMERARKDSHLKKLVTNVMTFDDTVRVLKNKGIISEATKPAHEIIPGELRKGINYELGLTYEAVPDWDSRFIGKSELDSATKKAMKNLEKDSLYYTKLIGKGEEPKQEAPTADVEFKEGKVQKTDGKIKADGSLKKEVKKDEKSNVQTTLSKKERKKGKPEGVKQLKEGIQEAQADGTAVGELLSRVAEDWGQDSDLYSDLTDAIAGWSDRHGNLTPKGILAIKNLLSNWDVLEDYEELLSGNTPQPEGDDDDIPAIYRMYNSDDWVQAQRNMEETVDSLKEGLRFIKGKSREEIKEIVREQILKELEKVVDKNTGEVIKLANDASAAKKFVQSQSPQVASQLKVTS